MRLSGADIVVRVLIEQGCKVVFGYPGGQILNVYDSLYKYSDEIEHILTAHEQGAVHAADGFARVTGQVGVVISTSGPGATNLVTGIANAYLDSIPMVAICGDVATNQIGSDSFQEVDITGVTLPITKHNYIVTDVNKLADTMRNAFRIAKSGRPGPVLIDIPKNVQAAVCDFEMQSIVPRDEPHSAKDTRIKEAADCINTAERPYIYIGGGLINSDARDEMLALAETTDAVIGSSIMGLSCVPTEHPRFLGMQGMHGHYASSMAMHNADCIIALGVRFNDRVTGNRAKFAPKAKIIHIDIDGSELSKNIPVYCGLRGDIKKTLEKLLPLIKTAKHPEWWSRITALREEEKQQECVRDDLSPQNVIRAINRRLSPTTPVATDVGQHQMWSAQGLVFRTNRRFVTSGGLGTMGFGLGAAIGASYGTLERSVLITGDGSFGMCLNELATAVTYNVPVVIIIMNNGVLGMVRQWQTLFYNKHYSNTILNRKTDFASLAVAFGAKGEAVNTPNELEQALTRAFASDGPYVIDCAIDKDEFVLPMLPPGGSMDDIITRVGD